jgi:hypothetical protein
LPLDAFLFLQRSDIAHFLASRPAFGDLPLLFIDPGLVEEAVKAGIDPNRFSYRPLEVGRHFQADIATEARARAALIDQALTRVRRRLFGDGAFQGWDAAGLWLFLVRALTAQRLGEVCDAQLPEGRIGVFRPTLPQRFYFDSFLATDLFVGCSRRFRVVDEYDRPQPELPTADTHCFDFARVAALARAGGAGATAVVHIPTCYANQALFTEAIKARFPAVIDLPSPMWDIAVHRSAPMQVRLDQLPRDHLPAQAAAYRDEARRSFEAALAPLVPGRAALQQQAECLAAQSQLQAINHHGLLEALRGTRPHFVLSDHDTGSLGPLFSVAAALQAPVTVLPHSAYPAFVLPHALRVRVIERVGFDTRARTVLGEPVAIAPVALGALPRPVERAAVQTVCLLVNTLHGQGLSYIDLAGLTRFHRRLSALCRTHGARLVVRLKPNAAGAMMAASAFELPEDGLRQTLSRPLHEIAAEADLCITYGEPTTGGIEFLGAASYLLGAGRQHWPADQGTAPGFVANAVVECIDDEAALAEVDTLLGSPAAFRACVALQQARFGARLQAPQPVFTR